MKSLYLLIIVALGVGTPAFSDTNRAELPAGTTLRTKIGFWAYEIKGRKPYGKDIRYIITSSKGRGIGESKYRYIATLPAGTQLEIIGLIKKNKQQWLYIVRVKNYDIMRHKLAKDGPSLEGEPIIISSFSMLNTPVGKQLFSDKPHDFKTTKLHPDLFTDFVYPEE